MPQRLQVDPLQQPGITPVATPVDTYVRPTAGIGLAQVAEGLSQFAPALARFGSTVSEQQNASNRAEGEAAARRLSEAGATYAQAAKDGSIPRSANPFFMAGFKEQWGRVTADKFSSDLRVAVASNPDLQTATDLGSFDQFVTNYRKTWADQNIDPAKRDKFFELGFGHRADAYYTQERQEYAAALGSRVEKMSDDALFSEAQTHIIESYGKAPDSVIAQDLETLSGDMILQGRNSTSVNQAIVRAIAAAATTQAAQGDPNALKILDLADKVNGGTGPLGRTQYASDAEKGIITKARQAVNQTLWQANEREKAIATSQREAHARDVYSRAIQAVAADPHASLSPFVQELSDDVHGASELATLQQNMNSLSFNTDPEEKRDLFTRIWAGDNVTPQTVTASMNRDQLSAPDAAWLIGQMSSYQEMVKREKDGSEFNDFQFKQTLSSIDDRFKSPTGFFKEGDADRSAYAKAMLMDAWVKHLNTDEGKKEDPNARGEWLTKTADRIVAYERNGAEDLTKASKPNFQIVNVDPMKTPILSRDGLTQLRNRLAAGQPLDGTASRLLQSYGITSPAQIAAFIRAQMGLLTTSKP